MFKKMNKINFKFLILILALLLSLIIVVLGYRVIYLDIFKKINFESDIIARANSIENEVFSLEKIYIYSSANARQNELINQAAWSVDISQFSDIAIFINNHSENGLTDENTIKKLYLDNFQMINTPTSGNTKLYYKNRNDFGKLSYSNENKIGDSLKYDIIPYSKEINYENPEIYNSSFSPICIGFVNENIKSDYKISETNSSFVNNGSLLKKCNISLNSISCTFSFNINIVNNLNQHYISKIFIDIPLKDDNSNIYDGYMKKEITDSSTLNKFYIEY